MCNVHQTKSSGLVFTERGRGGSRPLDLIDVLLFQSDLRRVLRGEPSRPVGPTAPRAALTLPDQKPLTNESLLRCCVCMWTRQVCVLCAMSPVGSPLLLLCTPAAPPESPGPPSAPRSPAPTPQTPPPWAGHLWAHTHQTLCVCACVHACVCILLSKSRKKFPALPSMSRLRTRIRFPILSTHSRSTN